MKNNSSPEIYKKKVKTGHKKHAHSRRTLNDVNEVFRILPDDDIFTPGIFKNEQVQTDSKETTNDTRKTNLINFSKNIPDDHVTMAKMLKKNENENLNNSKTNKKRDINECFPNTILNKKKTKENDKISKEIKEDTLKKPNYTRVEVVDKENLRKNSRKQEEDKAIKEDSRKNLNYKHACDKVGDKIVDKENLRKNDRHFREEDKSIKEDSRKKLNNKHAREEVVVKAIDKENLRKNDRYFREEDKSIKEDSRKKLNNKHAREEVVVKAVDKENLRKNDRYFREEDKSIKEDSRKKLNYRNTREEVVVKAVDKEILRRNNRNFREEDRTIKEDTAKNQNYKHAREEIVDKENLRKNKLYRQDVIHRNDDREYLRKNNTYYRDEDINRSDIRKKFNSLVRDEAKGDIKQNIKLITDLNINISKPIGDVQNTNNGKSNRVEKDTENRGGGDIGKQIKGVKLNENKKIDDKRIYSNIKEVPAVKPFIDIISRGKIINETNTVKMKNSSIKVNNTDGECANEINSDFEEASDKATPSLKSSKASEKSVHTEPKSVGTKPVKKPIKTDSNGQRKPIIKTVRVKNDNRVYKSVTFVDRKQPTPLLISIPTHCSRPPKKEREQRHPVKHNTSKDSFVRKLKLDNEKSAKVKKRSKKRRIMSPELFAKGPSPPTEVAQWAPSCITHQTKPYYEAWVNTTATAKCMDNDEFTFHRNHFVRAFKTELEKPISEEIVFDKIGDERYTGKIRVRHR